MWDITEDSISKDTGSEGTWCIERMVANAVDRMMIGDDITAEVA